MNTNEYKCALCGNVYEKGRSDEEAMAEAKNYFDESDLEDAAVVCDDCWNKIHPQRN